MGQDERSDGDWSVASGRVLVVLDLQKVVGRSGQWELPGLTAILPRVLDLLHEFGSASVLTQHRLDARAPGRWSRFAERWAHLDDDPTAWELLDEIARAVPHGASVVQKFTYSAFELPEVQMRLTGDDPELVLVGCETDCCVAATMFAAVDAGVGVVLATDAIAGPDSAGHDAMLRTARRLPEQVRLATAAQLLRGVV
jgi:nicotinamidase-related amidase